jgi:probable FeS assembly SUF system protein SufT
MNTSAKTDIILSRDCAAVLIPQGLRLTLNAGETVTVVQKLGGHFTVYQNGNLARIEAEDADALGFSAESIDISKLDPKKPVVGEGWVEEEAVWAQLKTCFDPEIPVNIVELGLVYECDIEPLDSGGGEVRIQMTLTAAGCGMGPFIVDDVRNKVMQVENVMAVDVKLVWDPPWSQDMMSEEAQLQLGLL